MRQYKSLPPKEQARILRVTGLCDGAPCRRGTPPANDVLHTGATRDSADDQRQNHRLVVAIDDSDRQRVLAASAVVGEFQLTDDTSA